MRMAHFLQNLRGYREIWVPLDLLVDGVLLCGDRVLGLDAGVGQRHRQVCEVLERRERDVHDVQVDVL